MIFLGNTTMALGIVMFVLPNELMTGGTTGLSLIIDHYLHLPISVFVFIFNCIMFLLGALILGFDFALTTLIKYASEVVRKYQVHGCTDVTGFGFLGFDFALTTLISTFYYPIALGFFQNIPSLSTITDDRMLSSIFGGLFIGFSLGIVIRCGASTGGMDIPPLILNKKFGLPVSVMLYVFDFLILIGQALFCDKEAILYGILLVMTYTIVLDKILVIGQAQTQVKIISQKSDEINEAITRKMDRGSTLLHTETGYLHSRQNMILTVISNRELSKLNQLVMEIDPTAFMIIGKVNEVHGNGFTLPKKHAVKTEK